MLPLYNLDSFAHKNLLRFIIQLLICDLVFDLLLGQLIYLANSFLNLKK